MLTGFLNFINSQSSTTKKTPLNLDESALVGSGAWRNTYISPTNNNMVVKILHPHKSPEAQKNFLSVKRSPLFRHTIIFDQNRYDLWHIKKLHARHGNKIWQHFPKTYGIIPTNLGDGLLQQRILNVDTSEAPTMEDYLKEVGNNAELTNATNRFLEFVSNNKILLRDNLPNNIIVQTVKGGKLNLVMVDGYGNSEFIKVSNYIPYLTKKKIERKANQLLDSIRNQELKSSSSIRNRPATLSHASKIECA